MTEFEFEAWVKLPETQEILKILKKAEDGCVSILTTAELLDTTPENIVREVSYQIGFLEGVRYLTSSSFKYNFEFSARG